MPASDKRSVIARIIAAHNGIGPTEDMASPAMRAGLNRAVRRAGMPHESLMPQIGDVAVDLGTTLGAAVEAFPTHGLLAAIEDGDGRRGLIMLGHPLVDALIEVQTTGRVEEGETEPRPVTRIDEALAKDFLEMLLAAFGHETGDVAGRDWPDRMRYGSLIRDRAQLNLLMPESPYHQLRAEVTLGGKKRGQLVILLPSDPAIARRMAAAPRTAPPATDRDKNADPRRLGATSRDWSKGLMRAVGQAPLSLDAVLMHITLPLGEVQTMAPGYLVPFDPSDLGAVALEAEDGHVVIRGALGQIGGRRALRFGPPIAPGQAPDSGFSGAMPPSAAMSGTGFSAQGAEPGGLPPLGNPGDPALPMGFDPSPTSPAPAGPEQGGFDPDAAMGVDDDAQPLAFDPNAAIG